MLIDISKESMQISSVYRILTCQSLTAMISCLHFIGCSSFDWLHREIYYDENCCIDYVKNSMLYIATHQYIDQSS